MAVYRESLAVGEWVRGGGTQLDNNAGQIRQLSTEIYRFREKLKSHLSCFIQGIRLTLDGISLGNGIKIQALLIQFQASLAARLWAEENCVVVHIYVWMQASTYSTGTKFFHAQGKTVSDLIYSFILNLKYLIRSQCWQRPGMKQGCVRVCVCMRACAHRRIIHFCCSGEWTGFPINGEEELVKHLQDYMCCGSHYNVHCSPGSPLSFFLTSSHLPHMPHPSRLSMGLVPVSIN